MLILTILTDGTKATLIVAFTCHEYSIRTAEYLSINCHLAQDWTVFHHIFPQQKTTNYYRIVLVWFSWNRTFLSINYWRSGHTKLCIHSWGRTSPVKPTSAILSRFDIPSGKRKEKGSRQYGQLISIPVFQTCCQHRQRDGKHSAPQQQCAVSKWLILQTHRHKYAK